ncbi:MAG: serine/threonine protein kinase [Myxococcales bacterium]|nr:MAG: serine/threonine protein kinase [Myxococcales bacterium]
MSDEMPALAVGTLVAGKLRIVRALGMGGMGTVYEVEHELTRHRRALKLLHAELASNQQAVARFLREASAAGRIGNPHIVETFDAGTLEGGEPYLVMEMLDGRSLADILADSGRLSERDAVDWIAQACDGLQAAHDAGIIHRDIKPDNLFVQRSGKVKILDFGISKFDEQLTGEKQLTGDATLGTPYYMAPEQTSKASSVDQRADVYALGVVLYECVTGRKPFEADTYPQLVVRIHLGDYEPASSVCGTSALVDGIIGKAMARRPEARFQTPAELAAALRDALRATERAASPFDSTQRASETAFAPTLVAPTPQNGLAATILEVATAPASLPASTRTPAPTPATHEATLLSAGTSPPARGNGRWLVAGAALLTSVGAAIWWKTPNTSASAAPQGLVVTTPPVDTRGPSLAPSPADATAPSAATALAPSSSPVVHHGSLPPSSPPRTSKSVKTPSRVREHALEEENPFR